MQSLKRAGDLRLDIAFLYGTLVPPSEVTVHYRHSRPIITLLLPSRKERCQFSVKPMLMTVGSFLQDVQKEDKGINSVTICTEDGAKISTGTMMDVLLRNNFKLIINDITYHVQPPARDEISSEHVTEMDDIKSLVHSLYAALHLEDHQLQKERELLQKLDTLREQLQPFEQVKAELKRTAEAKSTRLLWVGLALLSTQGGALAWLTWWVYSWDIMEPVTYFITYGSAMAFYAYFILTKQDSVYPDAKDRQFLNYFYRKAGKQHFDVDQYNRIKEDLAETENNLRRLRDPLQLRLPIQQISEEKD
ncbi:calcium uniporter regulatory subunit MCUb, mitochondrial isoform X2 [Microcaecilia unicolor]|nr:calcium uniporter regulatory subunit MCUb, mitochondrial isoform X2 [Microcaecilia unicolor]XP_030046667.1 calcium uniporter regulatory subunit MCUb, mitochondrial isoform X2 [Microcaecilia unicolor]XP_030046669.1 calcium uniporter regulatory subunit MCUb, mitochondrial isoform X2 [Microcaecilia unicolor]